MSHCSVYRSGDGGRESCLFKRKEESNGDSVALLSLHPGCDIVIDAEKFLTFVIDQYHYFTIFIDDTEDVC